MCRYRHRQREKHKAAKFARQAVVVGRQGQDLKGRLSVWPSLFEFGWWQVVVA
jgi:hypothetical protein